MKKVFKVADIHELLKQVNQGEISYSRMVEIMNEMANEAFISAKTLSPEFLQSHIDDFYHPDGNEDSMIDTKGLSKRLSEIMFDEATKVYGTGIYKPEDFKGIKGTGIYKAE